MLNQSLTVFVVQWICSQALTEFSNPIFTICCYPAFVSSTLKNGTCDVWVDSVMNV